MLPLAVSPVATGYIRSVLCVNSGPESHDLCHVETAVWVCGGREDALEVGFSELGIEPHDLMRPEDASSQEVKQIVGKLITDITSLVNSSLNKMNSVVQESDNPEK